MTAYEYGQKLAQEKYAAQQKEAILPLLGAAASAMLPSMGWGALIGGGIGAMTADKGQGVQGALRGAATGALSGGVAKGLSVGMKGISGAGGLLGTAPVQSWMNAPGQGMLGKATRWGINKGSGEFGMGLASAPFMPGMQQKPKQQPMTNIPAYY